MYMYSVRKHVHVDCILCVKNLEKNQSSATIEGDYTFSNNNQKGKVALQN